MNKIDAIKDVLERRADVLREVLKRTNFSPIERAHYLGKKDGYDQAIDLLGDCLESITVELEPVEGVVHHYENVHWIVTDQEKLTARLKHLRRGEKVRIIIEKEGNL